MEATIIHGGQCHGSFCTFLFRGIFSGLIELTNSTASLSDSHSCRFTLRSIRWGTISPPTFTGGENPIFFAMPVHGEQKLLAAAKCGDRAAFDVRMIGITVAAAKARLFHARVALRKDSGIKTITRTTPNSARN